MKYTPTFLCFLSVFFSITFLLGSVPESFSESELKTVVIFVDPPNNDQIFNEEQNKNETPETSPTPSSPQNLPTSFITGNNYALNSNQILISSNEGIELNNLLIEQIEEWTENSEHTEQFWSRTDQVIMGNFGVVNALQNPLTKNNYHIDGTKYSENTRSNLQYFVQERGYDLDNLENIPNHMISPKKYDLSRAVSKQMQNPLSNNLDIQHVRDLRDVSPNELDFTPEQKMQIFRQSIKSTSFDVVGSLMPKLMVDESMFLPESKTQMSNDNPLFDNGDESESLNSNSQQNLKQKIQEDREQELFQQTTHIKDIIADSETKPNYAKSQYKLPLFEILSSIILSIATVFVWHKIKNHYKISSSIIPLITVNKKYDYIFEVESLLDEASVLYEKTLVKDAYEKLSQSIRIFYSNKLNLEKEVITSDLIPLMKNFKESEKSLIKHSLQLSDMIKFAKHSETKNMFDMIKDEFSRIVRDEKS